MSNQRCDVVLISDIAEVSTRIREICAEYGYSLDELQSLEAFLEEEHDCRLVLVCLGDFLTEKKVAEVAQAIRFAASEPFLICSTEKPLNKEAAIFAKKSGADLLLLNSEICATSKAEFAITQVIRANFLAVKPGDIRANDRLPCDLYHLMPQRKKFLRFLFRGDEVDQARLDKIQKVGEVYVARADIDEFSKYVSQSADRSAAGLARRCRARFLALLAGFAKLVFLLTDQCSQTSYGEGQELLNRCKGLCSELLGALGEYPHAWEIINNSAIGELGTVERAPTVASYAALFGLQAGLQDIDQIMISALLGDVGLVFLSPSAMRKIRSEQIRELTPEELKEYRKLPDLGLEVLLSRKLSLNETCRSTLLSIHERADGTGFPKGVKGDKIPMEAQLIRFSQEFDRRTLLKMGRPRPDPQRVLREMIESDLDTFSSFTSQFLSLMKAALLERTKED